MADLTDAEKAVVAALGEAWNLFLTLPVEHNDDTNEFRHAIHSAQDKVLGRAGRREINGGFFVAERDAKRRLTDVGNG